MKLDRNDGRRKYAIVKLRAIAADPKAGGKLLGGSAQMSLVSLEAGGFVKYGHPGDADEFFVVMLKDKYAAAALSAYARAALEDDPEYAGEVLELAKRAATHPNRKRPD